MNVVELLLEALLLLLQQFDHLGVHHVEDSHDGVEIHREVGLDLGVLHLSREEKRGGTERRREKKERERAREGESEEESE